MCVCDYQFSDEGQSEVIDRLKEMLDIDTAEEDLDTSQETPAEIIERDVWAGREEVCVCRVSALGLMISWLINHSFNSERIQIEVPCVLLFYFHATVPFLTRMITGFCHQNSPTTYCTNLGHLSGS